MSAPLGSRRVEAHHPADVTALIGLVRASVSREIDARREIPCEGVAVGADLSGAYNITDEQLAKAKSLKGVTMPDGTVHD